MTVVGAYEAKTKLSELLDRAEQGEHFTITRHGRPIAQIVPAQQNNVEQRRAAMHDLQALSRAIDLGDVSWADLKRMQNNSRP